MNDLLYICVKPPNPFSYSLSDIIILSLILTLFFWVNKHKDITIPLILSAICFTVSVPEAFITIIFILEHGVFHLSMCLRLYPLLSVGFYVLNENYSFRAISLGRKKDS